jgi:hypothetical protein
LWFCADTSRIGSCEDSFEQNPIPSTQKYISIQLYYKIDKDNKIELYKESQKSQFVYDIDYKKAIINSKNIKEMKAWDLLDLNIITYDKNS